MSKDIFPEMVKVFNEGIGKYEYCMDAFSDFSRHHEKDFITNCAFRDTVIALLKKVNWLQLKDAKDRYGAPCDDHVALHGDEKKYRNSFVDHFLSFMYGCLNVWIAAGPRDDAKLPDNFPKEKWKTLSFQNLKPCDALKKELNMDNDTLVPMLCYLKDGTWVPTSDNIIPGLFHSVADTGETENIRYDQYESLKRLNYGNEFYARREATDFVKSHLGM